MFALVDAVEQYPEFLPWCGSTKLLSRDARTTIATIEINYRGIRQSFTTENTKQPTESMHIALREGPFKELDGRWQFTPLGASGCKVALRMEYSFTNSVLEAAVGTVFGFITSTMIERFVARADAIYGSA